MDLGDLPPLRSLPRAFVPDATDEEPFDLPKEEIDKFRHVLRLSAGALIAALPGDDRVIVCRFQNRVAEPVATFRPETEPLHRVTIAQALPKGDKLDEIVRACTEAGAAHFLLFASERTVVRWDEKKREERLRRLSVIAREAAEVSFRTRVPEIEFVEGLDDVFRLDPHAVVLSEVEGLPKPLERRENATTVVIGPEGGWTRRELQKIGPRGVTLGPRVLRVDHAGLAAVSILLLARAE
jgi:16S rRNA (uracil1498-N3)-methyltransferase